MDGKQAAWEPVRSRLRLSQDVKGASQAGRPRPRQARDGSNKREPLKTVPSKPAGSLRCDVLVVEEEVRGVLGPLEVGQPLVDAVAIGGAHSRVGVGSGFGSSRSTIGLPNSSSGRTTSTPSSGRPRSTRRGGGEFAVEAQHLRRVLKSDTRR